MRPFAAICALAAGLLLAGCGVGDWAHGVGGRINPDTVSYTDRCAALMQAAMPLAEISIDTRTAQNTGIDTMFAHIAGIRTDHPTDKAIPHDLAVDCKFDDGVLTEFHWTSGAPQH
jgi:hypothetical protein